MDKLSHLDEHGQPRMVDVSAKADTEREAVARCLVFMNEAAYAAVKSGAGPKGEVLSTAKLAGIMGAKQTPHLIPLCHPLLLAGIDIDFKLDDIQRTVQITATVKSLGKTGVEMEAMTAAAVAALTVYDMCKAVDKGIRVENLRLVRKSGGKSGKIELE